MTDLSRFLARYGLPVAAVSFAAGITYGRYGPGLALPPAWLLATLAATLLLLHFIRSWPHLNGPAAVIMLFFAAGLIHLGSSSKPPPPSALNHLLDTNGNLTLSGRMATAPSYNGIRGKVLFRADQLWQPDGKITPISEPILLTMPFAVPEHLAPGDRLLVRATLSSPQPPGTPGSFDYRQYLADRGIHITGYLRSPACLTALHLSSTGEAGITALRYWPQRARQKINRFITEAPLPPLAKGLYLALVVGDLELVPPEVLTAFRTSGTFHLLSISGTHLGLLGLLSSLTFNLLLRRSRWLMLNFSITKITAAITIFILLIYSLLAGMNPPVVRALIMAVCLLGAMMFNRPHALPNSLGLAMLVSLIWNPADLFHASFQLSYAAVTGIVILYSLWGNQLKVGKDVGPARHLYHWILISLTVSLAALLATAPITQYHFRQVALISPLSTLFLAPLLCFWSLPLGLTASFLSTWFPTAATSLLELGSLGLVAAGWLNDYMAGLSINTWQPPTMPLTAIPFYYFFIASLLFNRHYPQTRAITAAAITILLVLMITPTGSPANDGETRVTFLDVGQGSATLLEFPGGRNILIDGGSGGGKGYDIGAEVIEPFLHHLKIRTLEAVVITHDHGDHYNGLATIIDQFQPAVIWTNDHLEKSPELAEILAKATRRGAAVKVPAQNEDILSTPTNRLTCLSRHHLQSYSDLPENSRSLVLRLNSLDRIFLMPGDIMETDGKKLQEEGVSLRCDVLLAPHHGSDNSGSLILGAAGRPKILIISAGGYNGGKFPGEKVKEWCGHNGATIHRTGDLGSITFAVNPEGMSWRRISAKGGQPNAAEAE